MAKKLNRISMKQIMIDKSNSTMVLVLSLAAFFTVFSLMAAKTLFTQMGYNNKVIAAKSDTLDQLKEDLLARDKLVDSYKSFTDMERNMIGGSSSGTEGNDGNNADIITDALPPKYDFPALTTSLEKMVMARGLQIDGIEGSDDQIQQESNTGSPSPEAVVMPFSIRVTGSYLNVQDLINDFQRSIRPFVINDIMLSSSGQDGQVSALINAQTYYQPAKNLNITKEVVK